MPDDSVHQDTLEERLRQERPERVRPDEPEVRLIDDESETGDDIQSELGDEGGVPSAEEAAIHIRKNAPGAVDSDIDSYTGEPQ